MAASEQKPDPKAVLNELKLEHVPPSHKDRLRKVLWEFTTMWDGSFGLIRTTEHQMDLMPDTRPFFQPRGR